MKVSLGEIRKNPDKYKIKTEDGYRKYNETKYSKRRTPDFPHANEAPHEITMIQIYDNFTKQYIVIGRKDFTGTFDEDINVKYIKIEKEKDLLEFFIRLLDKLKPSIISGFNSKVFDCTTITNRVARVLDGFDGDHLSELNHKNSYENLENVKRLSPVGVVTGRDTHTLDGMDGVEVFWKGILLLDYRELALKYGFLGLASYSLKNIAKNFNLSQKIDNSSYKNFDGSYTGDKYIFPEIEPEPGTDIIFDYQKGYKTGKYTKAELEQVVFNRFVEYSLRDVEILVQLDEITGYLNSHKGIAYTCSVSMDDNWGTLKHWTSLIYRESFNNGIIIPLKQQFSDDYAIFLAGWVRTMPGKYDYVTSFDFTSLYPSLIRAFNVGGDTLLKEYQIPQELKDLREKYFTFFTPKMLNRDEYPDRKTEGGLEILGEHHPLGSLVVKHKGDINDMQEELDFYVNLMNNSEEISNILKKYNVCATPNGYFYRRNNQSILASQMETIFAERVKEKREGQRLAGVVNDLKSEGASKEIIQATTDKQKYHENQSLVKKILLNSVYGAACMDVNPFSQGKITGASITTGGRMANMLCALAGSNKIQNMIGETTTTDLKYVAQADTDSHYLNLTGLFKTDKLKGLDKSKKIELAKRLSEKTFQDNINDTLSRLGECLNLMQPEALAMENEVVTSGFVSLKNKRYFCRVEVKDGVVLEKPKMKVIGVSLVSYSTPEYIREKLKPVLDIILDGDVQDLRNYIADARKDFANIDPVNFSRTVKVSSLDYNRIGDKYKRQKEDKKWLTAPLGSTAALEHNRVVSQLDIVGRFPLIERGDSLSYVYVKMPNRLQISGAIGFNNNDFSKEINLKELADYNLHWEKDFLHKIDIVLDVLNWNIHKKTESISVW